MTQNANSNNVNAHQKNGYSGIQLYSLIPLLYVGKKERKDGSSLGRIGFFRYRDFRTPPLDLLFHFVVPLAHWQLPIAILFIYNLNILI